VYEPPFYVACHYREGVPGFGRADLHYRLDSTLLVVSGARNEDGGGEYYYVFKDGKLTVIQACDQPVR